MKKFAFAGAAAAALIAVPVLAAQQAQPVSRAEVQSKVQTQFARVDTDRDGFITQTEAQAVAGHLRGKRKAQRGERRAELFARLDANHDGSLSREEFETRANRGDRAERKAERGERRAERRALRGERGIRLGGKAFTRADADKDGRVSLAEATASRLARFDRLDANRDGSLTREERRQARAARQARRNG